MPYHRAYTGPVHTAISRTTLEQIAARLDGLKSGGVAVQAVEVELGTDSTGDEALIITLTLPDIDAPTWPVDSVLDIRRQLNEIVADLDLPLGWVVILQSTTPTEFDDDRA